MKKLIFTLCFLSFQFILSQSEICKIVGTIALPTVESGAFLGCMSSANALACKIAFAAHQCAQDLACSGIVEEITESGCKFIVKKTNEEIEIIGTTIKENARELEETYNALNTVEGINWLMIRLSP